MTKDPIVGQEAGATHVDPRRARQLVSPEIWFVLRLLLGISVTGLLLWRIGVGGVIGVLGGINYLWLGAAVGVQLIGKLIWSTRWSILLGLFGYDFPLAHLVRAILVGQFFNNFLPTAAGGDLYRAYWAVGSKRGFGRSLTIVIIERIIGLIALGYVTLPALLFLVVQSNGDLPASLFLVAGGVAALCGGSVLLQPAVFERIERMLIPKHVTWFARARRGIRESLVVLSSSKGEKGKVYATSVVIQFVGIAFFYCLGRALGVALEAWQYLVIVPLVSVVTMLPITLNGLGLREGALVVVSAMIGANMPAEQGLALGLLSTVVIAGVSLLGGYFYIEGRNDNQATAD